MSFFFNGTAPTEIYTYLHTLSLHNALPIWLEEARPAGRYHGSRGPGLRDDAAGAGQCHIFVTTRDAFRLYAVFTPRGSHPVPRRTPSRPPVPRQAACLCLGPISRPRPVSIGNRRPSCRILRAMVTIRQGRYRMMHRAAYRVAIAAAVVFAAGAAGAQQAQPSARARASMKDLQGQNVGEITLTPMPGGVLIRAELSGLPEGWHGSHLPLNGVCEPPFASPCGHFNPGHSQPALARRGR